MPLDGPLRVHVNEETKEVTLDVTGSARVGDGYLVTSRDMNDIIRSWEFWGMVKGFVLGAMVGAIAVLVWWYLS
jgi:hypothetical protein